MALGLIAPVLRDVNLVENVVIIISFILVVLSQSQLGERVKPRCSATVQHGGRCLYFLDEIPRKPTHDSFFFQI